MTDRVDPMVNAMQPPIRQPALDRMPVHALINKLPPAHPPMLPRREPRDRVEIASHTEA